MDNPIRILHVLGRLDRGGAETMVMNLYRSMDRSKIQFDFIVHTQDSCAYDKEIKALGGRIYKVPRYKVKNHLQYKNAWNKFFKEHCDYKIIHGHVRSTATIYLKIAKKYGLTTIAHSHNTSSGNGLSSIVKKILQRQIRYVADYLFACSKTAGEWLYGNKYCKQDNFHILNNAIDSKKFIFNQEIRDSIRKEFEIEDKLVLGHIGRFQEQKNHEFLIDIFSEVYKQRPDTILILVGDGDLEKNIKNKVIKLGLKENIIFTGIRSDIPELLSAMDVLVFPSLWEGLPVAVVEAQAAGLPCIISDVITKEVVITPYIRSVSLQKNVAEWADIILSMNNTNRENSSKYIIKHGFDIRETSTKLTAFYLNL